MSSYKPLSIKILVWSEVVIAARILLYEAPITVAELVNQVHGADQLTTIIRALVIIPVVLYLMAGILTLAGNAKWKEIHYGIGLATIILNLTLIAFLNRFNEVLVLDHFVPSVLSVLMMMAVFFLSRQRAITNKRILLIDDDASQARLLDPLLSTKGFDVTLAVDGEEGLKLAKRYLPDLIILDVMMPGMSGHEVCVELKKDPSTKPIPVLFLTAKDSPEDVEKELKAGAVGHFTKPINSTLLIAEVKRLLHVH